MIPALQPDMNCPLCPRLQEYREKNKQLYPKGWNAPVPPWGDPQVEFLIVGLAPGVKGANLSGRPFTGDYAGMLLYNTLVKYHFASGIYKADPQDGLSLGNCRIINAVRCVPPENKPTSQEEKNCRPFLLKELHHMPALKFILTLGVIAHKNILACFNRPVTSIKFKHGQFFKINDHITVVNSYHVSRYNTSTGVLTTQMFEDIVDSIQQKLK
ncbi:uracil-DNA glycosylase [Commensalibacter papalotli (ex Botero et al. 2024)]|uniref:Type-5 uracil-DNA glycosylase n=1 Tax=Commensalibacter papalotli (ex Botero et al. 2024) TaxID=2972766 RepID=A0ABM9HJD5_9PROT|nr:uracil-DNA glycosylase [Commensalibacter papalotli (ex Botero et al. 2024)]CAI3924553.1 Uracil-DNA glycosylase (Udg4) (PDB:3IKB) [Commensalibacter papalotli (ex Botero et al. 2024)]CAI3927507.1 Uracil-DNA glycosylase (Udg4) (PDB:3IKB) [Commensalibacter papalotli (ex Botero et al. 2024)]